MNNVESHDTAPTWPLSSQPRFQPEDIEHRCLPQFRDLKACWVARFGDLVACDAVYERFRECERIMTRMALNYPE